MAQLAQDHWRECTCLMNLVMLELEAEQPALALDYSSELIHVSAQMGEGSEAPHAAALDAVIRYLLQEKNAAESLERARQVLKRIDSPRMLSYIQTLAAAWDLQQGNLKQAIVRAEEALESAQALENSSELTLAWVVVIQSQRQLGNLDQAKQHLVELKTRLKGQLLNVRAQKSLAQLEQSLHEPL
jgi:tetratricopeptide (TPR) repeat protein